MDRRVLLGLVVVLLLMLMFVSERHGKQARWARRAIGAGLALSGLLMFRSASQRAEGALSLTEGSEYLLLGAGEPRGGSPLTTKGGRGKSPRRPAVKATEPISDLRDFCGARLTPEEIEAVEYATRKPYPEDPPRVVDWESPGLPYRDLAYRMSPVLHHGQRKLLISEIDFLSRHGHRAPLVVYAGAAPGVHIPFLAALFPDHHFELYDPHPFALGGLPGEPPLRAPLPWGAEPLSRIAPRRQLFTDDTAREYASRNCLFLSDIRTGGKTHEAFERAVQADLDLQRGWVEIIRPKAALLKFRTPFLDVVSGPETEYLDGELRLQAWAPPTSAETRLEVLPPRRGKIPAREYDNAGYEALMFYHNAVRRYWVFFPHDLQTGAEGVVPGLDHCFDCRLEIEIWREYLRRREGRHEMYNRIIDASHRGQIASLMNAASAVLGLSLDRAPHGALPETPMLEKADALARICSEGGPCRATRG